VLFAIRNGKVVLLHGFIKKTRAVPEADIRLAQARWKGWEDEPGR
jgi:phage-related protein